LTPRTTLQGSYTHRDYEEFPSNASFTRNAAPETWSFAARYQKIIYLSLTQVVSDSTYVEAKLAQTLQKTASNFPNADRTGYQDIATGLYSGGWTGPRSDYPHREKRNIKAGLSHFRERGWAGSHNIKAGFETEFAPLWRQFDLIDDTFHLLRNGQPYRVRLYNTPLLQGRHVSRQAAYVQDEWTLKERFTLNLGGRFEWSEGFTPEQEGGGGRWVPVTHFPEQRNLVNWFEAAPRLGLVWDVQGNQRTSFKLGDTTWRS
jgi:outer membrane receptor protein involved in Fe transport